MAGNEPLLNLVQVNVMPEWEDAFNDYYWPHIPHLLKMPGWDWGQRYIALRGDRKYMAIEQIKSAAYLESLMGPDHSKRLPLSLAEWELWDKIEKTYEKVNAYEQISGTPFGAPLLRSDRPLKIEITDVAAEKEQEWNHWYDTIHMPNLLKVPGYVMGGRFRLVQHPATDWLQMGPKYLAVFELESEEVVPSVMDPERMSPEARAEMDNWENYCRPIVNNLSRYAYKIISKHWAFEQPPEAK